MPNVRLITCAERERSEQRGYTTHEGTKVAKWIIAVASVILLCFHFLLRFQYGNLQDGIDLVALGLIVVALSPWLMPLFDTLEIGGLKMRFIQVEAKIDKQQRDIAALTFMLTYFISYWELHHLQALADGIEFTVDPDYHAASLEKELRHLRELGLIDLRTKTTIMEMCRTPEKKNLHEYVYITDRGRNFLKLRSDMMKTNSI